MTATLTRPSLADIVSAFEALDAEGKFYLLDHLADKAGADLPREVAYQIIEADEDSRLGSYSQGDVDVRVDRLWAPLGKTYLKTRREHLEAAFKTDAERRAETLARLSPAQREKRLEYIKGEGR